VSSPHPSFAIDNFVQLFILKTPALRATASPLSTYPPLFPPSLASLGPLPPPSPCAAPAPVRSCPPPHASPPLASASDRSSSPSTRGFAGPGLFASPIKQKRGGRGGGQHCGHKEEEFRERQTKMKKRREKAPPGCHKFPFHPSQQHYHDTHSKR